MKPIIISSLLVLSLTLAACGGKEGDHAPSDGHGHEKEAPAAQEKGKEPKGDAEAEEGHEGEEEGSHVELTQEQIKAAGIEILTAGPSAVRETLPLYGVIAPNAERVREVSARFPGPIRSVASKIGDEVRQGQLLATVESDESLESYAILAPLAGVITARNANPGEQSGNRALFTVADLSTVWVELSLFPRDLAKVRVGQKVQVKSVDAGLSAQGELVYVAPFGSNANQTLTGRVLLDNAKRTWAPGLYVSALVTLAEQPADLAVRNSALQQLEEKTVVFVEAKEGEFEPRPVRVGRSDGEFSEVLEGLKAGERYVAANSFVLKSQLGAGSAEHGH